MVWVFLACSAEAAPTASQPQVDLGDTSFLDGEAGPGALLEVIGNGTTARYFTDASGHALDGRHEQWTSTLTLHPAYVSSLPLLGGALGMEALIPVAAVHLDLPGQEATTQGGVGDVTVAPLIQWSGLQAFGRPLAVRAALQFVPSVGTYSQGREISTGQGAWQISPYVALTWRPDNAWELSARLIYDWSARNTHPPVALDALSSQAGDQVALDLAASRTVAPNWRVGIAGYALRQVSAGRIDEVAVPGSQQQVFALGPGFRWVTGSTSVIGTAYREFASHNRPEGFSATLRVLQPF